MKALIFTNGQGVRVRYKTDILTTDSTKIGNFQVMEVEGLTDSEEHQGINFRELTYNIVDFKQFASDHNLKLTFSTEIADTVLVDHTGDSDSGSISVTD